MEQYFSLNCKLYKLTQNWTVNEFLKLIAHRFTPELIGCTPSSLAKLIWAFSTGLVIRMSDRESPSSRSTEFALCCTLHFWVNIYAANECPCRCRFVVSQVTSKPPIDNFIREKNANSIGLMLIAMEIGFHDEGNDKAFFTRTNSHQ